MKNYIKKLRLKLGKDKFIHPGARIIIENEQGEILIIERMDNGNFGLPAGALEENETIEECIKREVKEETGLQITEFELIGISSNPTIEHMKYPNGDQIQYFAIEFYSNQWEGTIHVNDKKEIRQAQFMNPSIIDQLPENEKLAFESLAYYRKNGKVMLK